MNALESSQNIATNVTNPISNPPHNIAINFLNQQRMEQTLGAMAVRMRTTDEGVGDANPTDDAESNDDDVEIVGVEACTTSTNISDDFAHRGDGLQTMPFYVYRMYVRRILRPAKAKAKDSTVFAFEARYPLSRTYAQQVILNNISVPTIDGFQCPTWTEDAEQNSLLKALLFTPGDAWIH